MFLRWLPFESALSLLMPLKSALFALLMIAGINGTDSATAGTIYFVSPDGNDQNSGETWAEALQTIQEALELARPGDQVLLGHGEYRQDIHSVRDGQLEAPIRISGVGNVEIKGSDKSRIVEINHSYITLDGVQINGKTGNGDKAGSYKDKLVYIMGQDSQQGVKGVKILNVDFSNAGGECVRLKYFARHNEIAYSRFNNCGTWDFRFNQGGKNGEGIYIGTAPEQLKDNPTTEPDESNSNWIHDNYFNTKGNECVDIKEHSAYNVIERNSCTGQRDSESGGISVRGDRNIIRNNLVYNNKGVGVRLGGDSAEHGVNNQVVGNWLKYNAYGGIKIMTMPQGVICGNTVKSSTGQDILGVFSEQVEPTMPCD